MDEAMTAARWRTLATSVYLPTGLSFVGMSAIVPLLAHTARELGASVPEAAFAVALMGIGGLVGSLPAGPVIQRLGERRALMAALLADAVLILVAGHAPTVQVLGAAVFAVGLAGAILVIARQSFISDFVPFSHRARVMSIWGGTLRVGNLVGPLCSAALVTGFGLRAAYWLAVVACLIAAAASSLVPDLDDAEGPVQEDPLGLLASLRTHLPTYLTVGLGASSLMLVRASRESMIPLWATHVGVGAAQTSLLFAASTGVELCLFYLGGTIMDRYGRRAVAVPALVVMGLCFLSLPFTSSFEQMLAIMVAIGLGNGLGSGVVLTLGSDFSPVVGRHHFLAGWNLTTALGTASGPLLITALAAGATLAAASTTVGAIGLVGGAWLWHWGRPPVRT